MSNTTGSNHPNQVEQTPHLLDVVAVATATVSAVIEHTDLRSFFDRVYGQVAAAAAAQNVSLSGPAFALYHVPPSEVFDLEAGFPVGCSFMSDREVLSSSLPAGRVARLVHIGGYDGLAEAWGRLFSWVSDRDLIPTGKSWETYVTEPTPEADPATMRTELNLLLAQSG